MTVMEDGVLVAPNPYANPEAYYFPTAGRMEGVEILKGTNTLRYGPATVGGAINMITTAIPSELGGTVVTEVGEDGESRIFANVGSGAEEAFGWLLETHQQRGEGFKNIDRSNIDASINKEDYMAKFRIQNDESSARHQRLDLKLSYATEESNMSYLGLSDVDFSADPNRRYGLTEEDKMQNRHVSAVANYFLAVNENIDLHGMVYYNKFHRDWFKIDKINGQGQSDIIADANANNMNAIGILHGDIDSEVNIKHNNRDYISQGVQLDLDVDFTAMGWQHDLNIGSRFHQEEMDRVQPTETWQQINGSLVFESETPVASLTGSNNRFEESDAIALWAVDQIAISENLQLTLAVRFEEWEKDRADIQSDGSKSKRSDKGSEWLPGVGVTYQLNDSWQLLGGVYKGIALAGFSDSEDPDPEESINYEAGFRFAQQNVNAELIAFYNDYSNSVQNCSAQRPCDNGADTGSLQLGEAEVQGIEAVLGYTLSSANLTWPLKATYTYTDTEITKDADGASGKSGGQLAYIPENQLYLGAGVVGVKWDAFISARFTDEACTADACDNQADDSLLMTDSLWVLDFATHYQLNEQAQVYLKVDNLMDEQEIISRSPSGARANKPRTAMIGLKVSF